MIFEQTNLAGAVLVRPERHADERGWFARSFCENEFAKQGLLTRFVQSSISSNARRGGLRGLHYQAEPSREGKLVRCTHGAIYDVIVDLRRDSPSHASWIGVELSRENAMALYIPPGFAHGFQTLQDDSEVLYYMTAFHAPELARGVRWNDPAFGIVWPIGQASMSARDAAYADYVV
jgi:dTDP-4-dehydrorhamnose 3,5-epimerase